MNKSIFTQFYNEEEDCFDPNFLISQTQEDYLTINWVKAVVYSVYSFLLVIGCVGNGGVIIAVTRNPQLRTARNIFLLNLMASDLLLCLTTVPITPFSAINKAWIFGSFLCRLIPLVQSMSVLITSWSLTAIALDKFIHIRDATRPPIKLTQALIIMLLIWILACLVNVPFLLAFRLDPGQIFRNFSDPNSQAWCGMYCHEEAWSSIHHRRIYGTSIMALQFIIPTIIITFCYSEILRIVRRDMIIDNSAFAHSLSIEQRKEATRKKRKVNYILISMVVAFVLSWFPMTLINILGDFNRAPEFLMEQPWLAAVVCHFIAMTTVIWNPFLFYWLTRQKKRNETINTLAASHARLRVWMMGHWGKIGRSRSTTEQEFSKKQSSISVSYNDSSVTMHTNFNYDSPRRKSNGRTSSLQRSPISDKTIPTIKEEEKNELKLNEEKNTRKLDGRDEVKFLDPPTKSVIIPDFGGGGRQKINSGQIQTDHPMRPFPRAISVDNNSPSSAISKLHSTELSPTIHKNDTRLIPLTSTFSLPDSRSVPSEHTPLIIQNNGGILLDGYDSSSESSDSNVPTILVSKPPQNRMTSSLKETKKDRPVVYVKLGSSTRC